MNWQCKEGNCKTITKIAMQKEITIRIIFSSYHVNFQANFNVVDFVLGEVIEIISKMPGSS